MQKRVKQVQYLQEIITPLEKVYVTLITLSKHGETYCDTHTQGSRTQSDRTRARLSCADFDLSFE